MKKSLKSILPSLLILGMQIPAFATTSSASANVDEANGTGKSDKITIGAATDITTSGTSYAIDVWAETDATYTYKKVSTYTASAGTFTDSTSLVDTDNPEKDYTSGAGWTGFDGVKNRITVVNKSNAKMKFSATAEVKADSAFVKDSGQITFTQNDTSPTVEKSTYSNFETTVNKVASNSTSESIKFGATDLVSSSNTVDLPAANVDDQSDPVYSYKEIYYSISGEPKNANKSNSSAVEIGTITLSFSPDTANN